MLTAGMTAPPIALPDQHGQSFDLASLRGRRVLVFFFPKANTPGCTQQACALRDVLAGSAGNWGDGVPAAVLGTTAVVGVSPDGPAAQAKFDAKYGLGYPLLCDIDHAVAEAYGVWKEKSLYGKKYMGIERSAFLIGADGVIEHAWYTISPAATPVRLLEALGR
ncbi:MAG: peroxiredoxin [Ilumatobacteraceae bacterium]